MARDGPSKEKIERIQSSLANILQHEFKDASRFKADALSTKINERLSTLDSWIMDTDDKTNALVSEAQALLEDKATKEFTVLKGNPYYDIYLKLREATVALMLSNTLRDLWIETRNREVDGYLQIIRQTRDTEVEAIKLDKEKSVYDGVITDLRAEMKAQREQFEKTQRMLLDRIAEFAGAKHPSVEAANGSPRSEAMPESEARPEGELTPEENAYVHSKDMTKAAAIKYLSQRFPHWSVGSVGAIVGSPEKYVKENWHRGD